MLTSILTLASILNEHNAFNKMCKSLPKKEADRLKSTRRKQREEEIAHAKALEIANASRARNFWGN